MRESVIEKHLVARVKEAGGEVRKVQWIGRRGAPDRLVMLPGRKVLRPIAGRTRPPFNVQLLLPCASVWVELKATGKTAEAHQLREHQRMAAMGQRVVVIDSIEGVDALVGVSDATA